MDTRDTPEARLRLASARRKRLEAARLQERAAIVAALEAGMRQVDVVAITGFTREHIRRLATDSQHAHAS